MAEEHNQLKYGPSISKAGSVAAGGGYGDVGISRLSETLTPVIDLWSRVEWELLRGEILFAREVASLAVALRFSVIEFVNPSTSTKLAVIRLVQPILVSTRLDFSIDTGGAVAANPVVVKGLAIDSRFAIGAVSQCTITTGDTAAGATNIQWEFNGTAVQPVAPQWILKPGGRLFIATAGVNELVLANFLWSEREPFPGELQARG